MAALNRRDAEEAAALKLVDYELMNQVRQCIADTVQDPATAEALKPWYGATSEVAST